VEVPRGAPGPHCSVVVLKVRGALDVR